MILRSRRLMTVLGCVAALSLAGCAAPNTRFSEFGPVSARARLDQGVAYYYQIEIKQPMEPPAPRIWLHLPEGRIIDQKWFTFEYLQKAGFMNVLDQEYQPDNHFSHELTRNSVSFFFRNGALTSMRLRQTTGDQIGISLEHGKQFYTLPLSQEQLEQLFGKPDKVWDTVRM